MNKFFVKEEDKGKRLDIFVFENYPEFSRSFIKKMIENGDVLVDDNVVKSGFSLKPTQVVLVNYVENKPLEVAEEDIDFEIVFEDSDIVVVNKPQGLVVHPCSSTKSGTLVNGLLHKIKDLSGINGVLRPGIVHRLDKETSGLMIVAKNDFAHKSLAKQIKEKSCKRKYLALLDGHLPDKQGQVETLIERDKKDRKKMAVSNSGKIAITNYNVLKYFQKNCLVEFELLTGRTHQIRVHSAFLNHAIVGDKVYGKENKNLQGQLLHSYKLSFMHPRTAEVLNFEIELPDYFKDFVAKLKEFED